MGMAVCTNILCRPKLMRETVFDNVKIKRIMNVFQEKKILIVKKIEHFGIHSCP